MKYQLLDFRNTDISEDNLFTFHLTWNELQINIVVSGYPHHSDNNYSLVFLQLGPLHTNFDTLNIDLFFLKLVSKAHVIVVKICVKLKYSVLSKTYSDQASY